MPLECPLIYQVLIEWLSSVLWVPKFLLSSLQVKKVCKITGKGLLKIFIAFLKDLSEWMFFIKAVVFCFIGNKMNEFYNVILARYKSFKEFQKPSLNIL